MTKKAIGRPPKFKTPKEMQAVIDVYFEKHEEKPTVSGLARALGMSRRTLINYKAKKEFLPTIKECRARIEEALETNLYGNSVTGTIFNLKNNFSWKDQQDIKHDVSDKVEKIIEKGIEIANKYGGIDNGEEG